MLRDPLDPLGLSGAARDLGWSERVLDLSPLTIVRGGPGAGKSAALAAVATRASIAGTTVGALLAHVETAHIDASFGSGACLLHLDDVDRLDEARQDEVLRAVRRLLAASSSLRILMTAWHATLLDADARIVRLQPLRADAAHALLVAHAPTVSPLTLDRVTVAAAGCPGLIVAAGQAITDGRDLLAGPLPIPHAARSLRERIELAPDRVRQTLLDLAVQRGEPVEWRPAVEAQRVLEDLVGVDATGSTTALVRAVVLHDASASDLQSAHHRAATTDSLDDPDRRWHQAMSGLDGAALEAWVREDAESAAFERVAALIEVARRTTDPVDAARRFADAALEAALAGDLPLAELTIARAPHSTHAQPGALVAAALIRVIAYGDPAGALGLLAAAGYGARGAGSVWTVLAFFVGHTAWEPWSNWAGQSTDPIVQRLVAMRGGVLPVVTGLPGHPSRQPERQLLEVVAAAWEPEGAWRLELARAAEHQTRLAAGIHALDVAARHVRSGRWNEAIELAGTAARPADADGLRLVARGLEAIAALGAALRGDVASATRLTRVVLRDTAVRDVPVVRYAARHAAIHVAVLNGDVDGARAHVADAETAILEDIVHPGIWLLDVAEARAMLHSERNPSKPWVVPRSPNRESLTPLAREFGAALADGANRRERLRELIASSRLTATSYDLARALMRYGDACREAGEEDDARAAYGEAAASFEIAQADGWFDVAKERLRTDSESSTVTRMERIAALTEQEQRIAALAAAGRSNKEIGQELFLSPRTVGGHLYNIFPKLGVTSRAGLRDALTRQGDGASGVMTHAHDPNVSDGSVTPSGQS